MISIDGAKCASFCEIFAVSFGGTAAMLISRNCSLHRRRRHHGLRLPSAAHVH